MLDNCVSEATAKFLSAARGDNILSARQSMNMPRLTEVIEKREQIFMDRLLQLGALDSFNVVLNVCTADVFR